MLEAPVRIPKARSSGLRQRTVPLLPWKRWRGSEPRHCSWGIGDRTRWKPLFPCFAPRFTVCAMDRRGHGASGDSSDYSLQKEAEDVAAVVSSRPGPVFLMGHSLGALDALETAFITDKISKLVLYEPPLLDRNHSDIAAKMENMIHGGEREQALVTFLQEIVMISASEVDTMRASPSWADRGWHWVASS